MTPGRALRVLMLTGAPSLKTDKRIILTCNALAKAGCQVEVVVEPQLSDPTESLSQILLSGVSLHFLPRDYPEAHFLFDWACLFPTSLPGSKGFFHRLKHALDAWRQGMSFFCRGIRLLIRLWVKALQKMQQGDAFFLACHVGWRRCLPFVNIWKVHFWGSLCFWKSLELYHQQSIDLIYAHDLWSLPVAALLKDLWKVPLVYDTHEIGTEVIADPVLRRRLEKAEEGLYRRVDQMLTVNETIADFYRRRFSFLKPLVVVNAPQEVPVLPEKSTSALRQLLPQGQGILGVVVTSLGWLSHTPFSEASHHLLDLCQALRWTRQDLFLAFFCIGGGDTLKELQHRIQALGPDIAKRVFFPAPLPFFEVVAGLSGADFGIIPNKRHQNLNLNSPTKMYEYVQAQLPLWADQQLEVERLLKGFPIGKMADFTLSPESLAKEWDLFCAEVESGRYLPALQQAKPHFKFPDDFVARVFSGLSFPQHPVEQRRDACAVSLES